MSNEILGPIYKKAYFSKMLFELFVSHADVNADDLSWSTKFIDVIQRTFTSSMLMADRHLGNLNIVSTNIPDYETKSTLSLHKRKNWKMTLIKICTDSILSTEYLGTLYTMNACEGPLFLSLTNM